MMKSALFASLIFAPSALASVVIPGGALTLDQVTVWPDCNDPGQETPFQGCKNGADPWSDCSNGGGGGNGNGQGNNGQGNSATDPSPTDPTNVSPTDPTTDASPTTGNNANGNSNGNSNGRKLQGSSPECHKINICHGNANHWNAITVDRSSLSSNNGHAVANHNNRNRKLPDFLPGAGAIRNPRGAGQGYIDGNCQFVCDTGDCTYDCGGSCGGDPHMKLWNGDYYDYHGQCDLLFVDAPEFGEGLGLSIHLRTKIRYDYSFVESAAVRIGDDVLEVSAWGYYQFNGVADAHMPKKMGHFQVDHDIISKKKHVFFIQLQKEGEYLEISTFKDWVSVKIEGASAENFGTSVGLMGEYQTGIRYGRDGKTVIEDNNDFGQEWQVLDTEAMLFAAEREPQHANGQKCILPSAKAEQRRLGEQTVAQEQAEEACSFLRSGDIAHMEMCVYDVMASGDLDMAQAGVY